ncbi:MAG: hypothetical protein LBT19_00455 [Candidatus Nomurabacteria bacterium]|jgi:uncharacterized integral membrane protein|nr:hypothetical protein [Candidatus Nomurabacteria bacterium]
MSNGTKGGANQTGASVRTETKIPLTFNEVSESFDVAVNGIRDDAKAHDAKMEAYGEGTKDLIVESTKSVNETIEKTGKVVLDAIVESTKSVNETISNDGSETRKTIAASHKVLSDGIDTLKHRSKTTHGDIVVAVVFGVIGFLIAWNITAANTNLFINKFGIGILGFIVGGAVVIMLASFVRGLYEKKAADEKASPVKQPEPPKDAKPTGNSKAN